MVCAAAGLGASVGRLLSAGADTFVRAAVPYELLLQRATKGGGEHHVVCGPAHRSVGISTGGAGAEQRYCMTGVNAYDLAGLFGHAKVADTLRMHM